MTTLEVAGAGSGSSVGGPSFFESALLIRGPARSAKVGGPAFAPGATPSPISWQLFSLPDLATPIATLSPVSGSWQEQLSQPGSARLTLRRDDPARLLLDHNTVIVMSLYGVRAMAMLLEDETLTALSRGGPAAQLDELVGRGWLAALEWGLVFPPRGVGVLPKAVDRLFNWTAVEFPAYGWGPPAVIGSLQDVINVYRFITVGIDPSSMQDFERDAHDKAASAVWAPGGTLLHGRPQPAEQGGSCWFRWVKPIPASQKYWVEPWSDDTLELYFNGQLVSSRTGAFGGASSRFSLDLTAGDLTVAMHVLNNPDAMAPFTLPDGYKWNPGWGAWSIFDGDPTAPGAAANVVARSDGSGLMLAYTDTAPGMTPGQALLIAIREMQARGVLALLSCSFDEHTDTNGSPWPIATDISTRVGTDVLAFAVELAQTYIDVRMDWGQLRLHAYRKGEQGGPVSAAYTLPTDPADILTGNLTGLTHRRSF